MEVELAWFHLLTAGALEGTWAAGLKRLGDGFSLSLALISAIAMAASLVAGKVLLGADAV